MADVSRSAPDGVLVPPGADLLNRRMSNNGENAVSRRERRVGTRSPRTQAQRDAVTVEIGYALASAAFVAAVAFGVVAGPALFLELSHGTVRALVTSGGGLAT